jgi:hypothetical protein
MSNKKDLLHQQRQEAAKKLMNKYAALTKEIGKEVGKVMDKAVKKSAQADLDQDANTYANMKTATGVVTLEQVKRPIFSSENVKPPPMEPEVLFDGSGGGATEAGWHSIESMLKCPKEYQLRHVRGVREPQYILPDHFAVGSLFHAGRARWFTLRFATDAKAWDSIKEAVEHEASIQRLPVRMVAEQKVLQLLTLYCEHWSQRPKPKPLCAEYKLGPAPIKQGDPFMLHRTARLDDASYYPEANGKLCLGESKTTSGSINDCVNQYTLHGQPLLQLVLWKMAPQGEAKHGKVAGVMLDVAQKPSGKNPAKFGRMFIPVPDFALSWYVDALRTYLRAAAQVDWDTEVTRNIAMCTRMEGRARLPCEFRELCSHGRSAATRYVLRNGESLLSHKPKPGVMRMPWE